jgi:predicted nucleic acid-binding protein
MTAEARTFVDTNVLVYAVAADEPEKQRTARNIVEQGFADGNLVISGQVLLEFYVTVTRKVTDPLNAEDALQLVKALSRWEVVSTTPELVAAAIELSVRFQISAWDAAIIEAARTAGCDRVLSEDLSSGQSYESVIVENPFV